MGVCVCARVCVCERENMNLHERVCCVPLHMVVCMYLCVTSAHVRVYMHVFVCMYVCACVYERESEHKSPRTG